jgi:hypothetical protein
MIVPDESLYWLDLNYNFYYSVVIIPIAIILNTISFIIFINKKMNRNLFTGYINAFLCILNNIALTFSMGTSIFQYMIYIERPFVPITSSHSPVYSDVTCKLFGFTKRYLFHLPAVYQAFISFHCYTLIKYPSGLIKKKYMYGVIVLAIAVFLAITNMPFAFYHYSKELVSVRSFVANSTKNYTYTNHNQTFCTFQEDIDYAMDIEDIFFRGVLPMILMLVFSIKSIKELKESSRRSNTTNSKNSNRNKFIRSMISMNILFIVLYIPWSVMLVYFHTYSYVIGDIGDSVTTTKLKLALTITESIVIINNYSPIFFNLYYNQNFRGILLRIKATDTSLTTTKVA